MENSKIEKYKIEIKRVKKKLEILACKMYPNPDYEYRHKTIGNMSRPVELIAIQKAYLEDEIKYYEALIEAEKDYGISKRNYARSVLEDDMYLIFVDKHIFRKSVEQIARYHNVSVSSAYYKLSKIKDILDV